MFLHWLSLLELGATKGKDSRLSGTGGSFSWQAVGLLVGSALAWYPPPWGKHAVFLWFYMVPVLLHCLPSAHQVEPHE